MACLTSAFYLTSNEISRSTCETYKKVFLFCFFFLSDQLNRHIPTLPVSQVMMEGEEKINDRREQNRRKNQIDA